MTGGLAAGLARFVVRYRIAVAAAWGVVLIAATVALPSLDREVNSDPSLFLGSAARSVAASSLGAPLLGSRSASKITVVAARTDGPLTAADVAAVTREANSRSPRSPRPCSSCCCSARAPTTGCSWCSGSARNSGPAPSPGRPSSARSPGSGSR